MTEQKPSQLISAALFLWRTRSAWNVHSWSHVPQSQWHTDAHCRISRHTAIDRSRLENVDVTFPASLESKVVR